MRVMAFISLFSMSLIFGAQAQAASPGGVRPPQLLGVRCSGYPQLLESQRPRLTRSTRRLLQPAQQRLLRPVLRPSFLWSMLYEQVTPCIPEPIGFSGRTMCRPARLCRAQGDVDCTFSWVQRGDASAMEASPFSILSAVRDSCANCVSLQTRRASECAQFRIGFVDIFAGPMQA